MSIFERHATLTLWSTALIGVFLLLLLFEISLRVFWGLGAPVLYRSSPLFGYRPQPNQLLHRRGADIRVNNLGLRADRDWDENIENRILFLGNSVTYGGTSISNHQLFSHLAVQEFGGFVSGNAGVNGWGVENITALVVGAEFLPARTYITVLQEMDFYRGLSKLAGKPFWTTKPTFASQELLATACLDVINRMYEGHDRFVSPIENEKAVERSCASLKAMDEFLKHRGYNHLIYFSTDSFQLLSGHSPDSVVAKYLQEYDLQVIRLGENADLRRRSPEEQRRLFYDWNHLTVEGHQVWAKMIAPDIRGLLLKSDP